MCYSTWCRLRVPHTPHSNLRDFLSFGMMCEKWGKRERPALKAGNVPVFFIRAQVIAPLPYVPCGPGKWGYQSLTPRCARCVPYLSPRWGEVEKN